MNGHGATGEQAASTTQSSHDLPHSSPEGAVRPMRLIPSSSSAGRGRPDRSRRATEPAPRPTGVLGQAAHRGVSGHLHQHWRGRAVLGRVSQRAVAQLAQSELSAVKPGGVRVEQLGRAAVEQPGPAGGRGRRPASRPTGGPCGRSRTPVPTDGRPAAGGLRGG